MTELLQINNLTKIFKKGRTRVVALDHVSLSLKSKEIIGIVGESGSGKSTLGKLLIGLLRPTQGEILIEGKPLNSYSTRERARKVQMIFQDWKSSLNPRMTINQILSEPLEIHRNGRASHDIHAEILKTARDFNLEPELLSKTPRELSGGQLQRVTIARALSLSPRMLVADEPTSSLDLPLRRQVLQLLKSKFIALDFSLILISHDMDAVTHLATRILTMDKGKLVEYK